MIALRLRYYVITLFLFISFSGFSQEAEWVEQVIIANGNRFETLPPFLDYVTVQSYNPATAVSTTFDEIKTHAVQDVVISDEKIYVAANDSIIMYDANTLQRMNAIGDSGLSRLYVFENWLIVSKQYPIQRFFVEVLNANDLSLVARIQNISGDCKGITHTKDSIYVAVYGNYLATEGKLAVIDYNTWTLGREINFGPNAVGINDIYNYADVLFSINETPYGAANKGSITAYNPYALTFTNYVYNRKIGSNSSFTKNSGIIGNLLYFSYQYGVSTFNLDTRIIQDTALFGDPGSGNHIFYTSYDADYVENRLYLNVGNQISWGINIVGSTAGDSITSFFTGFNADGIDIDYRTPVGVSESDKSTGTVSLYPNPVKEQLRVKYTGHGDIEYILIRDITGKSVYTEYYPGLKGLWIDCSSFSTGMYFVTVKSTEGIQSTKMVKQ